MDENRINRFTHNRYGLAAMTATATAAAYAFHCLIPAEPANGHGFFFRSLSVRGEADFLLWAANLLTVFLTAFLLSQLDKRHAFIREYTVMYASFFLFTTLLNPDLSSTLNSSSILALLLIGCTMLIFNSYQQTHDRGILFIVSALLSAGSMFNYVYLFYVPVFMIGFIQMQTLSFKGFLAMLVGLITPYWIALGFGFAKLPELTLPDLSLSAEKYASALDTADIARIALAVAAGTGLGIINMLKVMTYRLQLRAYNGFFNVLACATLLFMAIDIANIDTYLTIFNLCVAIQVAHFFTIQKFMRRYALFFALLAANLACGVLEFLPDSIK